MVSIALIFAVGCSKKTEVPPETEKTEAKEAEGSAAEVTGEETMTEEPAKAAATDTTAKKIDPHDVVAVITMAKGGEIVIEFYPDDAPKTVDNFIKLANKGFYNGLTFHRVEPGFVVQGGDPKGNGTGDAGYNIPAEFNKRKHLTGTVAMARASDPNSASCQFYICLNPAPHLDGQYTVFGQTIKGMDVVNGIAKGDVMKSVRIVPK
jgi:peptidyl-prolyl cis-trans isomerase B (cyclophilin B)